MNGRYTKTQNKIISQVEEMRNIEEPNKQGSWKKYNGDVCVRIFREFILNEIPNNYTLSSPNSYINDFPTEFDLLIIKKKAKPLKYTNSYDPKEVIVAFEIKAHGIVAKREDIKPKINKIKNNFDTVKKVYPNIEFIYITFQEVVKPPRPKSIKYFKLTKKYLKPYKGYCLKDSRGKEPVLNAWEDFVNYMNDIL